MTHIVSSPYSDQKPGTSGLRKRVTVFQQPHYLENFVQSIFNVITGLTGGKIAVGGDGRFYNDVAIQTILGIAAANGVAEVIVGQNGIFSTPAMSHLIRHRKLEGGIVLSASHNPGGPNGDFGIKYNMSNGGPAPTSITDAIFKHSQNLTAYNILEGKIDITTVGPQMLGDMKVIVIDPVSEFADLMETLFDFDAIGNMISDGFSVTFDAMHAVTGPYATEIFVDRLKLPESAVQNGTPLKDFGGGHPDPNPVYAKSLFDMMFSSSAANFGAASDGDGDRYIVLGPNIYVSPSDSLAILAANAHCAPGYAQGIAGVARSMPTSRAADLVAEKLDIPAFETPTGWKYFGNLLEAGKITICGEESAGTSSDHIREKDGLWAILLWLNILAARKESVEEIVKGHWSRFGRHYYTRHDYEGVEKSKAEAVMDSLKTQLSGLAGKDLLGETVVLADSFVYTDPVDGSVAENQGLRVIFKSGSRLVLRLSGTGTQGATVRVYLENYEPPEGKHDKDVAEATAKMAAIVEQLTNLKATLGRDTPSVIS